VTAAEALRAAILLIDAQTVDDPRGAGIVDEILALGSDPRAREQLALATATVAGWLIDEITEAATSLARADVVGFLHARLANALEQHEIGTMLDRVAAEHRS
jgi:hypothetical protein